MVDFSKFIVNSAPKPSRKEVKISGISTDCFSGKEKIIPIVAYIKEGFSGKVFHIEGGPTGYENFYLDDEKINVFVKDGKSWLACMGTEKRWNRLEIPNDEMLKALKELGIYER